jgi:arylsulfatase A-like enzyme
VVWLILWVLVGCGDEPGPSTSKTSSAVERSSEAPDIVLALVSGVRSDGRAGQAFLDATGVKGLRFSQAYAQSPSTFASLGSILTGRYVAAIPMCGLLLEGDRSHRDDQQAWCAEIPEAQNTLAEVLGLYGYRTGFFTADLTGAARLSHGFQNTSHHGAWSDAAAAAAAWWDESDSQPRLMVVVLSDGEGDVLQSSALPRFPERKYQWLEPIDPRIGKVSLSADAVGTAYSTAAKRAGTLLGGLLERLGQARPRWSVVGSTNGMSLTERGGFFDAQVPLLQNNILVDRSIRVPLLLSGPGMQTAQSAAIVQWVDVFPTLATLAGAVAPAGQPGVDLRTTQGGLAYAEFGDMLSLRVDDDLLVFRCTQHNATSIDPGLTRVLTDSQQSSPGQFYSMYNVRQDPMQDHNVQGVSATKFERLHKGMIQLRTGVAAVPSEAITPERLWSLRMAPSDGYW